MFKVFQPLTFLERIVLVTSTILLAFSLVILAWITFNFIFHRTDSLPPPPHTSGLADWQAIQSRGRILVGVSGDFTPFSYYDVDFNLDGYDIAYLHAAATDLGLGVEFIEMSPDGMGMALKLGQIDAAVSGSGASADLLTYAEFTLPYFYGKDAVLTTIGGTTDKYNTLAEISALKIGVVAGTFYHAVLSRHLFQKGDMLNENIVLASSVDQALELLMNRVVDAIYMDYDTAVSLTQSRGFVLAGSGLAPMQYSIAVRKGNQEFIKQLNASTQRLVEAGIIAGLQARYFIQPGGSSLVYSTSPELLPTATPLPDAPPDCLDGMEVVDMVDQQGISAAVVAPGQAFNRTWRIKNIGTCPWTTSYRLEYIYGNNPGARLGNQSTFVQTTVLPGVTYDIRLDFTAGADNGVYQGFWQMVNARTVPFGERVESLVQVDANALLITAPTHTAEGGSGGDSLSGPTRIVTFDVAPGEQINLGECISLRWEVEGEAQWIRLMRSQTILFNNAMANGNYFDCPAQPGTIVYSLEAFGQEGSDRREVPVNVFVLSSTPYPPTQQAATATLPPAQATPSPIPPVNGPVIDNFTVIPESVNVGACVTISWSVSQNPVQVKLLRDGVPVLDPAPFTGVAQDCLQIPGEVVYTVTALGADGIPVELSRSVTVSE